MATGQITGRVKHMAAPISIIHEDIISGNSKAGKIKGNLNPSDIGTNPLLTSIFYRHFRQGRGRGFYPVANMEHGKPMKGELVNSHLTEFDLTATKLKL